MSSPPEHHNFRAGLYALFGFWLYSLTDVWGKILIKHMSAFEIAFWTAAAALVFLLIVSPWTGGLMTTLKTKKLKWHLVRAGATGFIPVLNFYALHSILLVNFYTIVFVAPFLTILGSSLIFKKHTSVRHWILMLLGLAGVLIALRPTTQNIGWPEIAVLVSAIVFAARNLIVPKMGPQETLLSYALFAYAAIFLFALPAVIVDLQIPPPETWFYLIAGGVLGAVGVIIVSHAFAIGTIAIVASMHYSQMIWGICFGIMVFGNYPVFWDYVGAAIVSISGLMLIFTGYKFKGFAK